MPDTNNTLPPKSIEELYILLKRRAITHHIPREIAEELANDTLLVAINEFNPERGKLKTFCYRVLINKIRNYIRSKPPERIQFDEELFTIFENPESILLNQENIMKIKQFFNELHAELDKDESRFLIKFEETLDELETRAVSETARRLGMEQNEGTNIMKRIVRKARKLKKRREDNEIPIFLRKSWKIDEPRASERLEDISNDKKMIIAGSNACLPISDSAEAFVDKFFLSLVKIDRMLCSVSFDNFWNKLSDGQKTKLSSF